jgi:hypothetical protein
VDLPNNPAAPYNLGTPDLSFGLPVLGTIDNTYQQVIDFNGDGRPDIVVATEGRNPSGVRDPNYWLLLINTPGPTGDPSDIVWLERQIDVTPVRAAIQSKHQLSLFSSTDQSSKPLPIARTFQVGAFDQNKMVESAILTQWKLLDVNGDGFPDLVFDSDDVTAFTERQCDSAGSCKDILRQDHPASSSLMVIYHTGPMMAGSGGESQNVWVGPAVKLRTDGACGVERMVWTGGGMRQLKCGFMEVNGDGLVDYVINDAGGIRAIRSSGLAEVHDVRLQENHVRADYSQHEAKRAVLLPGPVGVVKDPRTSACGDGTDGASTYDIEQQTALRDITGDGVADYIYFGARGALADGTPLSHPALTPQDRVGPQGWWFMAGTGVGFAAPRAIRTPADLPFALHISREHCNGTTSSVIATLDDVDGDGRPELVRAVRPLVVRMAKIVDAAGQVGAHSAGQLTAIDNRFGSVTRVAYGSAKSSWLTHAGLPYPEIVVTQTEQTAERGLGAGMAPVRYAYGLPEFIYHPVLGRWVFDGYRRRVTMIGETTSTLNVLKGTATIVDSLGGEEISGDLNRLMLAGRPHDVNLIAGAVPTDPRQLLVDSATLPPISNEHTAWKTQALPGTVPPLVPLEEECYATPSVQSPGVFGDFVLCRRTATAYVAEQTSWEGTHPYPAPDSVATRTVVTSVDDYARPTRITAEGDRTRTDDDVCLQIDYASPAPGAAVFLNAPHTARIYECGNTLRILAGVRHTYDNLPEGQVGSGFPSGQVLERYDLQTTALLEQIQSMALERDVFGNPVRFSRTRPDGAIAATAITYDPFGILPIRTETTATGLPQPLVAEVQRDEQTLLPMTVVNQNRSGTYNTYDNFGRLTRVSLSVPGDDTRYVLLETAFSGFDGSSNGRAVRHRLYSKWTPESNSANVDPATVTTYTEVLDEMGRRMHGIMELGSDYNWQSLVVNSVNFDSLGRPGFAADPFPSTLFGPRYGATFTYRADGRSECVIEGVGPQSVATTDETVDRYPTNLPVLPVRQWPGAHADAGAE